MLEVGYFLCDRCESLFYGLPGLCTECARDEELMFNEEYFDGDYPDSDLLEF